MDKHPSSHNRIESASTTPPLSPLTLLPPVKFFFLVLFLACCHAAPLQAQLKPLSIGHINDGGNAYALALSGHYACLANYDDGFRIYDISNPANPVTVGHTNNAGTAQAIAISGKYACLANGADGLRVYDISVPSNPVNIGHVATTDNALGIATFNNYAYLTTDIDGLSIYNLANPAAPLLVGRTTNNYSGIAFTVATTGRYAYLANQGDGLRVYDTLNPANLLNVGYNYDNGVPFGLALSGNYLYLADGFDGFRTYDLSNPAHPFNVGHAYIPAGTAYGVTVSGNYAFLANFDDGLHLYDISNPANPRHIASTNNGGFARAIAISGSYAYLANGSDGLRTYLLVPQLAITRTGPASATLTWPGPTADFALQKNTALGGANWIPVTNTPAFISAQNQVTLSPLAGNVAFRLKLQPPVPQLAIKLSAPNTAFITWSAGFPGYTLQQNANPTATSWTNVTNPTQLVSGEYRVTISPLPGTRLYRLKAP
ncbi:MAG: hypothetical protein JWR26_4461 [Pedosphaera sp.]|nr:hypothetical protein [Pedosphaera sp.]